MHRRRAPPPPRVNSALIDAPKKEAKKAWSKPSITLIDDIIYTSNGLDPDANAEPSPSYGPS